MALKDKIGPIIEEKEKKEREKGKEEIARLEFVHLRERVPYYIECIQKQVKNRELLMEAIEMIKPQYWQSTKMSFDDNDIWSSMETGFACGNRCSTLVKEASLFKLSFYGKQYLGSFRPVHEQIYRRGEFFESSFKRRCIKVKEDVIARSNEQAEEAKKHLAGSQLYIKKAIRYDYDPTDCYYFVLFKDGTVFTTDDAGYLITTWIANEKWILDNLIQFFI